MSEQTVQLDRPSAPRLPLLLRLALWVIVIGLAALAPYRLTGFWLQTGLFTMVAIIAAIGLTLLVGVAGQLSLGHAFFVAVGAYGYSYFAGGKTLSFGVGQAGGLGWPPLAALVGGTLLAGLAGAVFSPIAGRLRGIYLGIASLGLVFLGQHILSNGGTYTGGFNGRDVQPFAIVGHDLTTYKGIWYLGLVLIAISFWYATNLKRSRPGRALEAVRDSEIAASVMGVPVGTYKACAFTVSSMYAGVAGALLAVASAGHIVPESFGVEVSINYLVMIVIGGLGSVGGAALGAAFVTILPLALQKYAASIPFLDQPGQGFDAATVSRYLYGAAVVATLIFLPGGLASLGRLLRPGSKLPPRPRRPNQVRSEAV